VLTILVLMLADAGAAILVLASSMWFREVLAPAWFGIDPFLPVVSYATLWPVVPLLVGVRAAFGLYPGHGVSDVAQLRGQTIATLTVAGTVVAGGALFRFDQDYSRVVLVAWFAGLVALLPLVRAAVRWLLSRLSWFGVAVHVVALGAEASELSRTLSSRPAFGLRPTPLTSPAGAAVVHMNDVDHRAWDDLASRYARVWIVTDAWLAALPASVTAIDDRVALELRARLLEPSNRIVKRLLDLGLTLVAAPWIVLFGTVIAIAIRLEGPGPILVGHVRVGQGALPVTVWKFRTMVPDAQVQLASLLAADPALAQEWAATFKLRSDPRITRVGRFLRTTSLDELPQAWNVLLGNMTWVGPRPVVADELAHYDAQRDLYLRVRPGITGLVQVSGRSNLSYERRVQLDAFYVRNWSIWLDLVILARTVDAVLRRRGAV